MFSIRANKIRVALAFALAGGALASGARAQTATTRDAAMAETLFADAKKRMQNGDYAGACPKLAESYRLDAGTGTLTALALCHEQTGKTASAWAEFIEVQSEAQQAGRIDREKFARQHVASLEPNLSRLTINVVPETARLLDVEVHRDQVAVGAAAWGVSSPVDPGEHVIEATAHGKESWSIRVTVGPNGDSQTVVVPALDEAMPSAASEPAERAAPAGRSDDAAQALADNPPPSHHGSALSTTGLVVGAAGLVSLGVGSYFGLQAISKSSDAKQVCSPSSCTSASAVQTNQDAKSDAAAADVLMGAGLVAVIVGGILFLTAPSDAPASGATASLSRASVLQALRVVPSVGRRGGGMTLEAKW